MCPCSLTHIRCPAVLRCHCPGPHSVHISYVVAWNDASWAPIVVPFHMCVSLMNYQQNIYMNKKMYLRLEMRHLKPLLSFLFIRHLNPLSWPLSFAPCRRFVLYYHSMRSLLNTSSKKVIKQVKEALPILKTRLNASRVPVNVVGCLGSRACSDSSAQNFTDEEL